MELADYNTTAANNNANPPNGAPENGTLVADFNDIVREMMARLGRYARDHNGTVDTGGSDSTYTLAAFSTATDYTGMTVIFKANHTNTGDATLNVNGLGAQPLRDSNNQQLPAGSIVGNRVYFAVHNSGGFQVIGLNQHGALGGGTRHAVATATSAGFMSTTSFAKLAGIAENAEANPTAAQLKALYESNGNTNAFTDANQTKLNDLNANDGGGYNTPGQVLTALRTVDGPGSGLNADSLQGFGPAAFAPGVDRVTEAPSFDGNHSIMVWRDADGHRRVPHSKVNPRMVTVTGSRSLVEADANTIIEFTSSASIILTITTATSIPDGSQVVLANHGNGTITVASSGVDLTSANGLRTVQPNGMAVILKLSGNRFQLAGNLQ